VKLSFQEKPWDLYICTGYTTGVVGALLAWGKGSFFAAFLVLVAPGYVLVSALFPSRKSIDWIERIGLSLGLSLAVVPLLGLALYFSPAGFNFGSIVAAIGLFTFIFGLVAYLRRVGLPTADRLSATIHLAMPAWRGENSLDRLLQVLVAACVVIAAGTLSYTLVTPVPGERFTEFYLFGPSGNASEYPTVLNISEVGAVMLGIANHEATSITYAIRADLVGLRIVRNETTGRNMSLEVNRTIRSWIDLTVLDGQNRTELYSFSINFTGTWKLQFFLFRSGVYANQELHIIIRVS